MWALKDHYSIRLVSDSNARRTLQKKITIEIKKTTNEINKSIETLLSNEKKKVNVFRQTVGCSYSQ